MTIWFSTNIPEMRAIATFNRVSTDIGEIQHRITTGQRINSGKDDPGGLIIREGLRADIKQINAAQSGLKTGEILMETAQGGISQLLKIINGDPSNSSDNGLIGVLYDSSTTAADKKTRAQQYLDLYNAAVETTLYNNEKLIGGDLTAGKTYNLGGGATLNVTIADLSSTAIASGSDTLAALITGITDATLAAAQDGVNVIAKQIAAESGKLGNSQNVLAQSQKLLESRLTSVTEAEGKISNADIAYESSRMARAELLAQNAMNSIMYSRNYAAFAVSSLFG